MICFQETTDTGFGDRLRGILYLLKLCEERGEREVLYNDDETVRDPAYRASAFPGRMTDLIRIEGLSFEYHPLPFPEGHEVVVYDSIKDRKHDTRPAWREITRLRPRDEGVAARVAEIGIDRSWLGLHMRRTDMVEHDSRKYDAGLDRRALKNLRCMALRHRTRKVFLASDNGRSLKRWRRILAGQGYEVRTSDPQYDPSQLRQTGANAMLVDFFSLMACRRIVRGTPSEFSRFAAWGTGRRLGYSDLV